MTLSGPQGTNVVASEIRVSTDRWPLVHVRFFGHADGVVFERYLDELARAISVRRSPRVVLMDATFCDYVSNAARKQQAAWMRQHEANIREFTSGIAFVLPAAWLRGALSAMLWMQPLACAYAVVKD